MIDVNKINVKYKQSRDVCVLASYCIIVEYFSGSTLKLGNLFTKFINHYPGFTVEINQSLTRVSNHKKIERKEDLISERFHKCCRESNDMRGFDYFVQIHNNDVLKSLDFCGILKNNALKYPALIPKQERLKLRESLKDSESLAMILLPQGNNSLHSIVVGYDSKSNRYFKRDPNIDSLQFDDILLDTEITEYILFGACTKLDKDNDGSKVTKKPEGL